jgi:plasmid stability protein
LRRSKRAKAAARDERKALGLRVHPGLRHALRRRAADRDTSMEHELTVILCDALGRPDLLPQPATAAG